MNHNSKAGRGYNSFTGSETPSYNLGCFRGSKTCSFDATDPLKLDLIIDREARDFVCVFVCVFTLSCLNRLTYDLGFWHGSRP